MRELTSYEEEKWFDGYWFEAPEYISYGAEDGEAYDVLVRLTEMGGYGISDEIVKAAQIEVLDLYYAQIGYYTGDYGYEPEEKGLPPREEMRVWIACAVADGHSDEVVEYIVWDKAMEWREEHKQETEDRLRAEHLRKELERLEKRSAS